MDNQEKKIIATSTSFHVWMHIPKKRGAGFLKSPVSHHVTPLSQFISEDVGCDCAADAGFLAIDAQHFSYFSEDRQKEIIQKISAFLGYPYEIVSHGEFMTYLPTFQPK